MYPIFFETVLLRKPSQAGLHLVPNSIALPVGSLAAGYIIRRTGRYKILIWVSHAIFALGSVMMCAGMEKTWVQWLSIVSQNAFS